ncbi:MAG: M48 family metallopeptidase [Woeseiaceae bacterium]
MNFYDAQDRARRSTRWLVIVYLIATVLIVAAVTAIVGGALYATGGERAPQPAVLIAVAGFATLLIIGSTLYKTAVLSAGGGRVATDMGGTLVPPDVQDPLRKRLRNVIEEMAIASGVPAPEIYVLEAEQGINAFAAGYSPGDAAIAVTRGALEILDRDELQGVIAHEFSHILNGDMRLSIRMMGVLFGIMVLGLIGRTVLRGSYHGRVISGRRDRGSGAVLAIGLGLAILGWIGVLSARLIKAAISRRRESLADASAVQFTRQTEGLANALKKIGGYTDRSYIRAVDPEEVSHMLFSFGTPRLALLFATHPPLTERIQALDPSFREDDYRQVGPGGQSVDPAELAVHPHASFAALASGPDALRPLLVDQPGEIAAAMGRPDADQVRFASELRALIPEELDHAAHSSGHAFLLTYALALDRSGTHIERQLRFLAEQVGAERASLVGKYHAMLRDLGPAWNLPLLAISFPALKRRPPQQLEFLAELVRRLIEIDGVIDLYEYCLYKVLAGNLRQAIDPSRSLTGNRVSQADARRAALGLLRIVADYGEADDASRDKAFKAGTAVFGHWAEDSRVPDVTYATADVDRHIDVLRQINPAGRQSLIQAIVETVLHDRRMNVTEAELLRAICASLDCPLPPLMTSALPA